MQPINREQLIPFKTRVAKLEKMLSTCTKQIQINNTILEKILSCMVSSKTSAD